MQLRRNKVTAVIAVLLPLFIMLSVIRFGNADTTGNTVGWFSDKPATVKKSFDLNTQPLVSNRDCTDANIPIDFGSFGAPSAFENHCYVSTAVGLVEREGAFIQPPGYNKAYTITNVAAGGNPVLIPIPNQAGALWMRGFDGGPGVTLQYFKDLYNHISFDGFYNRFNITSPPELTFRYPDNRAVQFNFGSLAMDPNGRFMIADTIFNGFVRIDTLNLNMVPFADSLPSDEGSNATAVNNSGQLAVISHDGPGQNGNGYFKVVDIGSCSGAGFPSSSFQKPDFSCPNTNLYPQLVQSIPGLVSIANVRFANDRTITFIAKYGDNSGGYKYASYSITGGGQSLSLIQYEAVGDSYISGEGAFNYRSGTNTERNTCHQSLVSYPYLLSNMFSSFASVACSGAEMHNIDPSAKTKDDKEFQLSEQPTQQEIDTARIDRQPGYIFQNTFINNDNPEAVTLSIGGNDIGFASIIQKCINPFQGSKFSAIGHLTCYGTYEDRLELVNTINDQFPKLRSLYGSIKTDSLGSRRVYVVGYPQIAKVGGNCGSNVGMNADEVLFAHDLVDYLDSVIERAAAEAGVGYVNTQHAFDGQQLCDGAGSRTAVNGLTFANQPALLPDINASFHPNAVGHELLAGVVARQTHNLADPMPVSLPETNEIAVDPNIPLLQNIPHSGRQIRRVNSKLSGIGSVIKRSLAIQFIADSRNFFTKPGGTYTFNDGLITIGSYVADSFGNVSVTATLPADASPGFHTLHLYGKDVFGQPIDLQKVVYVAASDDDYDSDGVLNGVDTCPLIADSGVDVDKDGIDDVCDPLVATVTSTTPANDEIIWQDNSILKIDISATRPQTSTSP